MSPKIVPITRTPVDVDKALRIAEAIHSLRRARELIEDAENKIFDIVDLPIQAVQRSIEHLSDARRSIKTAVIKLERKS